MTSPTTERLLAAIEVLHAGERAAARAQLEALEAVLPADDWFHRCVLAHYLADAQDDAHAELRWDERALEAAQRAAPEHFDGRFPGMTLASFFPSLHLNLAADLEKLERFGEARAHAVAARTSLDALPDTPLRRMTRDAGRAARAAPRLSVTRARARGGRPPSTRRARRAARPCPRSPRSCSRAPR